MALIIIDSGHGGSDSGAVGNGLSEKNITLKLAGKVQAYLNNGYTNTDARMTRWSDTFVSLADRCKIANDLNANFFLSVHINSGGGTGYEDYIYNGLSDYSTTGQHRRQFHEMVIPVLQKYGLSDRGMKKADFYVLRNTRMEAILAEAAFIDKSFDAGLLRNDSFLNDLALAYAKGVAAILNLQPVRPQPEKIFDIIVGGFNASGIDPAFQQMKSAFPDWYMYKKER